MPLSIVILAAGQGTRMKSARPKVLHELAGKPLLQHVVDAGRALEPEQIIAVVGHGGELVQAAMQGQDLDFVEQREQLGTGHALQQCLDHVNPGNAVLVLFGDVPLIRAETMASMIEQTGDAAVCILSFEPPDPSGYGRVIRQQDRVQAIVEHKDATSEQRAIGECFSGLMLIRGDSLPRLVSALDNDNAQQEYYLTDVVGIAVAGGDAVAAVVCADPDEVNGVNNQQQLAAVERLYRGRQVEALMELGVKVYDPLRIDLRGVVEVGRDVEIDVNCVFEGTVTLGDNVRIGANCMIRNTSIAAGSVNRAQRQHRSVCAHSARYRFGGRCQDRKFRRNQEVADRQG
jgi:bifunctional UDP-N-acetylglucosamine pyrophosphorylase/glucosamine-1-phosphate N-acetyltransferase